MFFISYGEAIMDFIDTMEGSEIQIELKYCERCGGLWLRPQGTNGVYCGSCRACLAAMPKRVEAPPRKARSLRKARMRATDIHKEDLRCSACNGYLEVVARM